MYDTGTIFSGNEIAQQQPESGFASGFSACDRLHMLASKATIVHIAQPSICAPLNSVSMRQGSTLSPSLYSSKPVFSCFGFEVFTHQVFCQHYIDG